MIKFGLLIISISVIVFFVTWRLNFSTRVFVSLGILVLLGSILTIMLLHGGDRARPGSTIISTEALKEGLPEVKRE
jgi:hypothetical protein